MSDKTSNITPRQIQLLRAIAEFKTSECCSPSITDLSNRLGISRSTTFEHITELLKKGLLAATPLKARSLELTSKSLNLLNGDDNSSVQADNSSIPLLGRVAAGQPIDAVEDKQELAIKDYFGSKDDVFALRVTGNSMIEDDIRNGDIVICKKASTAANGQMVIAIVDDDTATLKRFYKEKNQARLQPSNQDYEPIYSSNCRIEAVVVGLVRKF